MFRKKGPAGRKRSDRKGNRTRQKNKRGDSKVQSNDSPEIPDRGKTSDISGLPSGGIDTIYVEAASHFIQFNARSTGLSHYDVTQVIQSQVQV